MGVRVLHAGRLRAQRRCGLEGVRRAAAVAPARPYLVGVDPDAAIEHNATLAERHRMHVEEFAERHPGRFDMILSIYVTREASMTSSSEILVVDPSPDWSSRLHVLATAPPRVVVVQADPGGLDEVVAHSRLAIVRNPDGTTELRGDVSVVDELDASARLFVEAWRESRSAKADRPGEGLPWDSPDFEPPDRPPH